VSIVEGISLFLITFIVMIREKIDPRWAFLAGGFLLKVMSLLNGSIHGWKDFFSFGEKEITDWIHFGLTAIIVYLAFGFSEILQTENYTNDTLNIFSRGLSKSQKKHRIISIIITILATWFVSFSLLSASAACGFVAPVILPILIRVGFSYEFAGAAIIAGGWGTIINPADVNASNIHATIDKLIQKPIQLPNDHIIPALTAIVIMAIILKFHAKATKGNQIENFKRNEPRKINLFRSIMLFTPFILLTLYGILSEFNLITVHSASDTFNKNQMQIAIILSFLISCMFAIFLAKNATVKLLCNKFSFGGLEGIYDVILLIIAAKFLITGLQQCIGGNTIAHGINYLPQNLKIPLAVLTTFAFAILTGSGDAIITSTILVFSGVPNLDLKMAASMIWFSGEIGRCASPNSAAIRKLAKEASKLKGSEIDPNKFVSIAWWAIIGGLVAALLTLLLIIKNY